MKIFNEKWAFALFGILLAGALIAGNIISGGDAGLFHALADAGNFIGRELTDWRTKNTPALNCPFAILLGILAGAFFWTLASGKFQLSFRGECGSAGAVLRNFAGGFLVMTGMLIPAESIWGEISGAARLAGGSWIFLGALIATGMLLTLLFSGRSTTARSAKSLKKGAAK